VTPVTGHAPRTVAVATLLVALLGGCTFGESTGGSGKGVACESTSRPPAEVIQPAHRSRCG